MSLDDTLMLARLRADAAAGRIREIRERSGLTQAELAEPVGVSPSTIAHWESRRRIPRGAAAIRYARVLARLEAQAGVTTPPARGEVTTANAA